jgi:tRNA dimethylallyltransferase
MLDVAGPEELFTAGEYRFRVLQVLDDLRRRGKLPIFTVGTGLYLRALLDGLADAPTRSETLRARLADSAARRGGEHLHRVLRRLDPSAAARISAHDRQKIVRALEVTLLARRPMTAVLQEGRQPLQGYFAIKLGLQPARAALYARINRRVLEMLERGWASEVVALLQGASPAAKPFEFIGYRELRACLQQRLPAAGARDAIAQATRRYAKRQLTWFRKEAGVQWLPGFGDDETTFAAAVTEIENAGQSCAATAVHPHDISNR